MTQEVDLNPIALGKDWWENKCLHKQILNQRFATVLSEDDLSTTEVHDFKGFRSCPRMPASMKASGTSEVEIDGNEFVVSLDLDQFETKELEVKTFGNCVEIHAKHGEKKDQYGLVSREFTRQYFIPFNCDIDAVIATLSTDCKLMIKAPATRKKRILSSRITLVTVVDLRVEQSQTEMEHQEFQETKEKLLRENGISNRDVESRVPANMTASEVEIDGNGFMVSFEIDQFESKELEVKTFGNCLEIHGEKKDQNGLKLREFTRQYFIPFNCDIDAVTATLSADCKLMITAPLTRKKRILSSRITPVTVVDLKVEPSQTEMEHQEFQETKEKLLRENGISKRDVESKVHLNTKLSPVEKIGNMCYETIERFLVTDDSNESLPALEFGVKQHAIMSKNKVVAALKTMYPSRPVSVDSAASSSRPVSMDSAASPSKPVSVDSAASPSKPVSVDSAASPSKPVSVDSAASPSKPVSVDSASPVLNDVK